MRLVEWRGSGWRVISLAAAAAALGLVAPAPANAVNDGVPFNAQLSGTAAFTSPTTVEFHGGGQAMYLGQFVSGGVTILESPTAACPGGVLGLKVARSRADGSTINAPFERTQPKGRR